MEGSVRIIEKNACLNRQGLEQTGSKDSTDGNMWKKREIYERKGFFLLVGNVKRVVKGNGENDNFGW